MKFAYHAVRKLLPPIASCLVCNLFAAQPSSNTLMKSSHSADSAAGHSSSKLSELPANRFRPIDMFDLETATEPQISPDGAKVVFDVSKKGDETEVRFTHEGLVPQHECFDKCSNAWRFYVNQSLRNLIATRKGRPNKKEQGTAVQQ